MSRVLSVDAGHPDESVVADASEVVRAGGVIVYPTETLYGIGADATNAAAIEHVKQAKRRREDKPILVIVNGVEMLMPFVSEITSSARVLMEAFWPGPLTMVFRASPKVPHELTPGGRTIGIRIPSNSFCLSLLTKTGVPLTSTSANLSGEPPARSVKMIKEQLSGIDLFIDAGELPESKPSTVLDVTLPTPRILRQGAISIEQLRTIIPAILQPDTTA